MTKGKLSALAAMQRELELAVLERDVELASAGGDPTARRVIEARKRVVDVCTRLLPYQSPRLEVVASISSNRPIHAYSDDELQAIVLDAYERERESAPPTNGNGGAPALLEHDLDEVVPYGKQR
jgi:hypothetical protein